MVPNKNMHRHTVNKLFNKQVICGQTALGETDSIIQVVICYIQMGVLH